MWILVDLKVSAAISHLEALQMEGLGVQHDRKAIRRSIRLYRTQTFHCVSTIRLVVNLYGVSQKHGCDVEVLHLSAGSVRSEASTLLQTVAERSLADSS